MAQAIPLILGAGSLFMQSEANRKAQGSADRAQASQDRLIQWQLDLQNEIKGLVENARKGGEFDPNKQIAFLDQETQRNLRGALGSQAGAMRIAGYKPGDSEIKTQNAAVQANMLSSRNAQAQGIRENAFARQLGAFRGIDTHASDNAMGIYGQRIQNAQGQQTSLAPGLMALLPYLNIANATRQAQNGIKGFGPIRNTDLSSWGFR